jgi:hypothetical protein
MEFPQRDENRLGDRSVFFNLCGRDYRHDPHLHLPIALFSIHRRAKVLETLGQLTNWFCSARRGFCITARDKFERLEKLRPIGYVWCEEKEKLIISNYPPQ